MTTEHAGAAAIVVGVVGGGEGAPRAALVAAIEAAGAVVEPCTDAGVLARAASIDAVVFDAAADHARLLVPAAALGADPQTRWLPRIVIVPDDLPASEVSTFGPALVLPSSATAERISAAVAGVVEHVRSRVEVERRLREEHDEQRGVAERIAALQQDGATLSHDARVLFGVIVGYASNLRDAISGPVSEVQRRHATNIVEAANGASSLFDRHVTSLRAIARKEPHAASRLVPRAAARRRMHDLNDIVRPVVALFEGVAAAKHIRLVALTERPVSTWCDSMQIKQALVNLISNALKFTPAGGTVEVEARFGPPASSRSGSTGRRDVELVVSDSGAGIPIEEREHVFERGVRLERDRGTSGSGIGLAVVRDVVELHGGVVRIEDGFRGGTSFVLTFPADLRARAGERTPAPSVVAPVTTRTLSGASAPETK